MPLIDIDQVTHPLLGRHVPTLALLLERSDPEARKTLETAKSFAHARIASQVRARAIATELEHPPWGEPALRWREPPRAVTSTDLLRALLALHGDRVAEISFASENVPAQFRENEAHWKSFAVEVGERSSTEPLELEPIWARRWALTDIDRPIVLDTLVGGLAESSLRQLAMFDDRYVEGLITEDEALNKLVDQMASTGVSARLAVPMPPAYWDRHGGVSSLDHLLARPPGVIVVGSEQSGRHALVEAWGRRLRMTGSGPLRKFGFNIDNFHGGGWVKWRGANVETWAAIDTHSIAVMSSFGVELDSPSAETRRFPEYCLEFANDPSNEFRLMIVTTPEELEQLERRLPGLSSFPKLDVPGLHDVDLLAVWVCQTLALEERLGLSLPVWRLVDRLAARSEAQRRRFDRHADLQCDIELTGQEGPFATAARRVLEGAWTDRSLRALSQRIERDPSLASWVDPESWPSLVRLDAALRGTRAG